MYTSIHYLQKLTVLAGETGLVVTSCLPKYVVSGTLKEGICNLDLVGARYYLVNSASSLRFFLRNSGQAGEASEDVCGTTGEVKAHLTTDGPAEGQSLSPGGSLRAISELPDF